MKALHLVLLNLALPALCDLSGGPAVGPARERSAGLESPRTFDHVLLISVDGLRSDALLALPPRELPGFTRLRAGASTLNARTDPDSTVTLPNHTGMFTGRPVRGEVGHGWIENVDPPPGATLHRNKGAYVAGIFDVAHDRGLHTALFAGKTKFSLYESSWNAENGAPDAIGEDQGRAKIDQYVFGERSSGLAKAVVRALEEGGAKSLVFAHFAETDLTAHLAGWDLTPGSRYLKAVSAVDVELVEILDSIQASETLRGRTAIILTADHGGGAPFKSHDQPEMWVDYIVPFLVWTGEGSRADSALTGSGEARDLYALNGSARADPGLWQPTVGAAGLPPIRNSDAANLALSLLALPAVPGSTINAKQDLAVFPAH